ncbi:MAG: histidine ammonia-lyase [Candidatus Cloacimonadota bacterium]|nr:MAG: histidine ammonia-lyase [Candidatus Cloacimonadota bacterium]
MLIDGSSLTLNDVWDVAFEKANIALSDESVKKVKHCREYVEKIIAEGRVVYGLTTGFGKFANITIPVEQIDELQENLILSHATGVGNYFSKEETRAIMLLRIAVLAKGNSGIRLETLQTLIDMLNDGIHPCIPEKGSVGASGDLAPLSHLALVLLGKGKAEYKGEIMDGAEAMKTAGINPVKLKAKEGLALNNGTQVMTGVGALALLRAERLAKLCDISASLTIDSLFGRLEAFNSLIHNVRPHPGQIKSAENLISLLKDSPLHKANLDSGIVQDPYSLRCTPQVHGACREALRYVRSILEVEINSATDNPLIFPDEEEVISGGNFHGEPVAISMDTLANAAAELANISERRMEQMFNPALNRGLNAFLAPRLGLDSGFMIAQLTAASLVSENKVLSHPASVDSIPTSANQEDHVSMGTIGAVKARNIIDNSEFVVGIEYMAACQALDQREHKSSEALEAVKACIRTKVDVIEKDRIIMDDINTVKDMVNSSVILDIANKYCEIK